jgi:hypothetical protein
MESNPNLPARSAKPDSSVTNLANQLDLFHGDANPAVARVYLRLRLPLPSSVDSVRTELVARLIGPSCEFAQTLPLNLTFYPLVDEPHTNALLAEATVPDPNFWTPELPFLYCGDIEVLHRKELLFAHKRRMGIRRFGARGEFLSFEGKRFVLRGVYVNEMGNGDWGIGNDAEFARESWTAVMTPVPNEATCEFASRKGVLLVADLSLLAPNANELQLELHRLAKWPAVCIAALPANAQVFKITRAVAPNLLLAQFVAADQPFEPAAWADLAIVEVGDSKQFAEKVRGCTLPVIAIRRSREKKIEALEQSRAGCDELQYDLARFNDYAGYIV